MLSIRLGAEIERRLDALAAKTGRSKSYYVRQAIEEHLEDMEDYFLAMQSQEGKKPRLWTQEELEKELDLKSGDA